MTLLSPKAFGARPDISARSVLVTVFGDAIVPAGGEIWLGDLIAMCQPFGFSDRLVRTSMFRLMGEDWFETERVGRRSRYRLTPAAIEEFALAEQRIYHLETHEWDSSWVLVFAGEHAPSTLLDGLRWRGFAELATGVWALPGGEMVQVRRLLERAGVSDKLPVAAARFDDLEPLVRTDGFTEAFGLSDAENRYCDFLRRYESLNSAGAASHDGEGAFATRIMMIHDLRRARLADPDLPVELLPERWPAADAVALAAGAYQHLVPPSDEWIGRFDGLSAGSTGHRFS